MGEADPKTERSPSSKRDGKKGPEERPCVLIIDGDPGIRRSLELLLAFDYRLVLCGTAREGVKAFDDKVQAVILDTKVEGDDGFGACDEIRKIEPRVPIIIYSASQDARDSFAVMNRYKPFAFIAKSESTRKLVDALETGTRLFQTMNRTRRITGKLKREPPPKP